MKYFLLIIILCLLSINQLTGQKLKNPTNNPVIGFINQEKFRISVEEALDRYYHPEKYNVKDTKDSTSPALQVVEGEVKVSGINTPQSEVHSAINPLNSANMAVSPIKFNPSDQKSMVTCPVYYSKDSGNTWQKSNFITGPDYKPVLLIGGGDPVMVFDAKGDLYFSWINLYFTLYKNNPDSIHAALFWAVSHDGGVTFDFDEANYFGSKIFSSKYSSSYGLEGMLDKQWMAADYSGSTYRNSVYASCLYLKQTSTQAFFEFQIYHKRGNESGFNRKPAIIKTSQFDVIQFGSIDVDAAGQVHFVFYGITQSSQALYHCVSSDGGETFSNPFKISNLIGSMRQMQGTEDVRGVSEGRMYPSPYMAVDKGNGKYKGNIYVTWSASGINGTGNKGLDIYFSSSTNNGKTWQTPKIINNDSLNYVHNFYPNIAVNKNGAIAVSWYDRRNYAADELSIERAMTDFYIGISYDGGKTFDNQKVSSKPSRFDEIGESNGDFGIGEYNSIMMTGEYAYPVWADGRTNGGNISIYMAKVKLDMSGSNNLEEVKPILEIFSIRNISPNPANEIIEVTFKLLNTVRAKFDIIDFLGKSYLSMGEVDYQEGLNSIIFDLSNLSPGTYFVRLSSRNAYAVKQFSIIK
ncbi:MAG: T9SS type A sorting domain-containing protein [Candidatus Kapabacteria bacterium]|nr:T9SS type A sorting domain-containing protein [Candidatus Kapabacteria bacterium]